MANIGTVDTVDTVDTVACVDSCYFCCYCNGVDPITAIGTVERQQYFNGKDWFC